MDIGKLYFASTMYVSNVEKTMVSFDRSMVDVNYKYYKMALVYQSGKNKFVDFRTGEKYKSFNSKGCKLGDKVVCLDRSVSFGSIVTDASANDSKEEILRKADMVEMIPQDDDFTFSYEPTETVYLSILDKEFARITVLLQLIYNNNLIVEDYRVRKYSKDNLEPALYIYMQVSGDNAVNKLESISKKFNISHLSNDSEDLEEYKNDVTYQKQKRIKR